MLFTIEEIGDDVIVYNDYAVHQLDIDWIAVPTIDWNTRLGEVKLYVLLGVSIVGKIV